MNKLLRYKFKDKLLCKSSLISTVIMVLSIIILCNIINSFENVNALYNVAIIDYDNSELSKKLIDNIILYKQINVSIEKNIEESKVKLGKGIYDVVYEIKKGYQQSLQNNNYDKVLKVHSPSSTTEVKWINDRISLCILKEWMFNDIFCRVKKINTTINRDKLEEMYEENNNKLLEVKLHYIKDEIYDINNKDKLLIDEKKILPNNEKVLSNKEKTKIFRIIWAGVILFYLINIGKEIIEDKNKGIVIRLRFSNINKITYYISYLIFSIVKILIPYILTYFILGYFANFNIFIINLINTAIYIVMTYLIVVFATLIFKSKKGYVISLQLFFLISIILSSEIVSILINTTYKISHMIPMYWYIR